MRNKFSILQTPDQNDTDTDDHQYSEQPHPTNNIEPRWQTIKTAYKETALSVLGQTGAQKKRFVRGWISTESWRKIDEGRTLKKTIDGTRSERLKNKATREYREKARK